MNSGHPQLLLLSVFFVNWICGWFLQ